MPDATQGCLLYSKVVYEQAIIAVLVLAVTSSNPDLTFLHFYFMTSIASLTVTIYCLTYFEMFAVTVTAIQLCFYVFVCVYCRKWASYILRDQFYLWAWHIFTRPEQYWSSSEGIRHMQECYIVDYSSSIWWVMLTFLKHGYCDCHHRKQNRHPQFFIHVYLNFYYLSHELVYIRSLYNGI